MQSLIHREINGSVRSMLSAVTVTQRYQRFSQKHAVLVMFCYSIVFRKKKNTLVLSHVLMCVLILQML